MFTPEPSRGRRNLPLQNPELYNLVADPEEAYDRAGRNAPIMADIRDRIDRLIRTFPEDIVGIYSDSMRRKVVYTPADALPVEDAP